METILGSFHQGDESEIDADGLGKIYWPASLLSLLYHAHHESALDWEGVTMDYLLRHARAVRADATLVAGQSGRMVPW